MGQSITVPKPSGRPWDSQLLSQSHPDAHGTVNFTAQSHPDAHGTVNFTAQSHPDARGTACHTFGTAVDGHGNADGYGPDASGTQQACMYGVNDYFFYICIYSSNERKAGYLFNTYIHSCLSLDGNTRLAAYYYSTVIVPCFPCMLLWVAWLVRKNLWNIIPDSKPKEKPTYQHQPWFLKRFHFSGKLALFWKNISQVKQYWESLQVDLELIKNPI